MHKFVFLIIAPALMSYQDYDIIMDHGPFELMSGPAYWTTEQLEMVDLIITEAQNVKDLYLVIATAEVESSFNPKTINHRTRDVGLFQINYHWHGKQVGAKTYKEFKILMADPRRNTRYALVVLEDMARYRGCKGANLPACYNGGPGWRSSSNRLKIQAYRDKVNQTARRYRVSHPEWGVQHAPR